MAETPFRCQAYYDRIQCDLGDGHEGEHEVVLRWASCATCGHSPVAHVDEQFECQHGVGCSYRCRAYVRKEPHPP